MLDFGPRLEMSSDAASNPEDILRETTKSLALRNAKQISSRNVYIDWTFGSTLYKIRIDNLLYGFFNIYKNVGSIQSRILGMYPPTPPLALTLPLTQLQSKPLPRGW